MDGARFRSRLMGVKSQFSFLRCCLGLSVFGAQPSLAAFTHNFVGEQFGLQF